MSTPITSTVVSATGIRRWGPWVLIVLLYTYSLVAGYFSLDFGFHWDEPVHFQIVKDALSSQTYLPQGFYDYPSATFSLALIARVSQRALTVVGFQQDDLGFYLMGRAIFMTITLAGGLFLFASVRRLGSNLGGILAATIYMFSWQIIYHSRWIAPDGLLASATCLFLLALVIRWRPDAHGWVRFLPFVAAGVAAGTKYQGGFLLIGALVAEVVWSRRDGFQSLIIVRRIGASLLAFLITFVVMTPGSLLQPLKFLTAVVGRSDHYHGDHGTHLGAYSEVVTPHSAFAIALARSIVLDMPSVWGPISLLLSLLSLFGAVALWKRDKLLAIAVLASPLLFFIYSSTFSVFIIRNFLLFLSFSALLAGLGLSFIAESVKKRWLTVLLIALVGTFILFSARELWLDAVSVKNRGRHQVAELVAARVNDIGKSECIHSSTTINSLLSEQGFTPEFGERITSQPESFLLLSRQFAVDAPVTLSEWPGTESRWFDVLGSHEVDFSEYPRWSGDVRALMLSPWQIDYLGLDSQELEALGLSSTCLVGVETSNAGAAPLPQ